MRVSLVGIDLITVEARIVVASIDTYLKYSEAVGQVAPVSRPATAELPDTTTTQSDVVPTKRNRNRRLKATEN